MQIIFSPKTKNINFEELIKQEDQRLKKLATLKLALIQLRNKINELERHEQ